MNRSPDIELCKNCGMPIGALETPMVWNDQVVCVLCYNRLSVIQPPTAMALPSLGQPTATPQKTKPVKTIATKIFQVLTGWGVFVVIYGIVMLLSGDNGGIECSTVGILFVTVFSIPLSPHIIRAIGRYGYIQRVGGRSFTCQTILVGWTILMWGITLIMFVTAARGQDLTKVDVWQLSASEASRYFEQKTYEERHPGAARVARIVAATEVVIYPLSIWAIFAVPFLIAAIVTTDRSSDHK